MQEFLKTPLNIGSLNLANRLIQGPLAGFSCAPFRSLFYRYTPPAYCVSEMISASDVLHRHQPHSRYLYRAPQETRLAYQLSGRDAGIIAEAAQYLQTLGADLIDLNCGCPKPKIRKKGAGSALLDDPERLFAIVKSVRTALSIPLTVKIRIQENDKDIYLAQKLEQCGIDALIVHGRRWVDDYDKPCNFQQIAAIKKSISIPVIANGDIADQASLYRAFTETGCDAFMIGRAGTGRAWLYQELLQGKAAAISLEERQSLYHRHLQGLSALEGEYKAELQSRKLFRYYFPAPELMPVSFETNLS